MKKIENVSLPKEYTLQFSYLVIYFLVVNVFYDGNVYFSYISNLHLIIHLIYSFQSNLIYRSYVHLEAF